MDRHGRCGRAVGPGTRPESRGGKWVRWRRWRSPCRVRSTRRPRLSRLDREDGGQERCADERDRQTGGTGRGRGRFRGHRLPAPPAGRRRGIHVLRGLRPGDHGAGRALRRPRLRPRPRGARRDAVADRRRRRGLAADHRPGRSLRTATPAADHRRGLRPLHRAHRARAGAAQFHHLATPRPDVPVCRAGARHRRRRRGGPARAPRLRRLAAYGRARRAAGSWPRSRWGR